MSDADLFQDLNADEHGYTKLAEWLKAKVGINMPPTAKNYTLMASRLVKLLRRLDLEGYAELHAQLVRGDTATQKAFIEAMTTNMTDFFREAHHFEVLPQVIREIVARKGGYTAATELRVWCAASSRGHEPYSILFTVLESGFNPKVQRLKFLASDIDQTVLETASKGVYKLEELHDVPPLIRDKYMIKLSHSAKGVRYKVRDELRELVTFARVNLVDFPYPFQHKFDIIFCRNVLIYFDRETGQKVKEHLAGSLAGEGYLFIGHSETGAGRVESLQSIDAAVFKKREEAS